MNFTPGVAERKSQGSGDYRFDKSQYWSNGKKWYFELKCVSILSNLTTVNEDSWGFQQTPPPPVCLVPHTGYHRFFSHLLCAFAKLLNATISYVMSVCLPVCPPVCPHGENGPPMQKFSWNFIFDDFPKKKTFEEN